MLNVSWLHDPDACVWKSKKEEPPPKILGLRHAEHSDIPALERLICGETYQMFGDIDIGKIYETSCLSVVQYNERHDIVSSVSLCNYPNIASVPSDDWMTWFKRLYRAEDVTERNTLFVHFLLWDKRYAGRFFEDLLIRMFEVASYCLHVILVLPPRVTPADVFEQQMIRIVAKGTDDACQAQSVYMTVRHLNNRRLKMRRIVEEDNDDVIPIIDAETTRLRELYGDYYISEMYRHPDGYREFIVSEGNDGVATGVMCLNRKVDVEILNENFELDLYNGLRKPCEDDEILLESDKVASEIFASVFFGITEEPAKSDNKNEDGCSSKIGQTDTYELDAEDDTEGDDGRERKSYVIFDDTKNQMDVTKFSTEHEDSFSRLRSPTENTTDESQTSVLSDQSSNEQSSRLDGESRGRTSVVADTVFDSPRRSTTPVASKWSKPIESEQRQEILSRSIFHGEPDAFIIEIFAVRKEVGNRWSHNFIEAAFECFPDLDYCIILLPFEHIPFAFLRHFVRVPLKCNRDFHMALYIVYRAAILGEITSRKGEPFDRDCLEQFLFDVPNYQGVLADFDRMNDGETSHVQSCILECNNTIVGLAVFCSEEHPEYVKRRYHVENYISVQRVQQAAYGRVLHFVLAPIFSAHQRFFLREIMRLNGFTVLYYRLYETAYSAKTRSHPLPVCLNVMMPLNPRRRVEYKPRGLIETDEIDEKGESFSLFMTTSRLVSYPSSTIDVRIVVVGASDCGVAFIERLALGSVQSYINFANLTLISPNGIPFERRQTATIGVRMTPFKGRYSRDYRPLVPLRAWTNVIYGTVTAINRKEKYVTVMNQGKLTYDYLVLTCGLQYQRPTFHEEAAARTGEMIESDTPWNCLTVNDDTEARISVEKIQTITNNFRDEKAIVFYGHNIDCYCALNGLLQSGVQGSWITLVEPPCETHDEVFFNDCEVDTTVMNGIIKSGVNILLGWNLLNWSVKDTLNGSVIESIDLQSKDKTKTILCDALFNFQEKTININAFAVLLKYLQYCITTSVATIGFYGLFLICITINTKQLYRYHNLGKQAVRAVGYPSVAAVYRDKHVSGADRSILAICRAGLVFDGELVVDPESRTNDPLIFAAGTMTKYSRKFYAESWQHKYHNSIEVGERLAEIVRKVIAVHQETAASPPALPKTELYLTLPVFRAPLVIGCSLPGGYHYLHVRKPGKNVSRRIAIRHDLYGEVMLTGSCLSEIGYFRIRLNRYDSVETLTCLSKKSFEVQHIIALYGKHEKMLNELKLRFRNSLISDFYAYFREPWATALFYDQFECLRVENRATLLSELGNQTDSLTDDCIRALTRSNWDKISEEDRQRIGSKYAGSVYQDDLEAGLLEFLQFSEDDLPVYCTPGKLRQLLADIEDSPLFFEQ